MAASGEIGHEDEAYRCHHGPVPALELLPPVRVEAIELVTVPMRLSSPLRSAAGTRASRDVLLVHVRAAEADGWAECAVEPEPTYSSEFTDAALGGAPRPPPAPGRRRADRRRDGPRAPPRRACAATRWPGPRWSWRCSTPSSERPIARSGRGSVPPPPPFPPAPRSGSTSDVEDLLAEADEALKAGAARLRVKIAPGRAAGHLQRLRDHVGDAVPLQADANGSFEEGDPELDQLDAVGLACLEQPLGPSDLLGHARLAARLDTPICLDEPLTSLDAIEAAIALGACEVVCLKPARVGGWIAARAVHDRCAELGIPLWVGGMLETGVGRAANLAVAALPHVALPPDMDPRGRYHPDLADPRRPVDGAVPVPSDPGTGAVPDLDQYDDVRVVPGWTA